MSEEIKALGRWLESTIKGDIPDKLDEAFPVKVTGLDIIRMRDAGLFPIGAKKTGGDTSLEPYQSAQDKD